MRDLRTSDFRPSGLPLAGGSFLRDPLRKVGPGQFSNGPVGIAQLGATEVGPAQIRSPEVRIPQVGALQIGVRGTGIP